MKHYVYRITNKILGKHYYGYRKALDPYKDLGIKYFSSSSDRAFIEDQKNNPSNYKYKIVQIFNDSSNALELEIKLHRKFNVSGNDRFYNKAMQNSSSFNTNGMFSAKSKLTGEYIYTTYLQYHLDPNLHANISNKVVAKMKGDEKYSLVDRETYFNNRDEYVTASSGKVSAYNKDLNRFCKVSVTEYHCNKLKYSTVLSCKVPVKGEDGVYYLIDTEVYKSNRDNYITHTKGMVASKTECGKNILVSKDDFIKLNLVGVCKDKVNIKDTTTGATTQISKSEFDSSTRYVSCAKDTVRVKLKGSERWFTITRSEFIKNRDMYITSTQNRVMVVDINVNNCKPFYVDKNTYENSNNLIHINNNAKHIWIYNSNNTIMFKTYGNFKQTCLDNSLPHAALAKSYRNVDFVKKGDYRGWYARKINI